MDTPSVKSRPSRAVITDDANADLAGLTVPQLRALADREGIAVGRRGSKQTLVNDIMHGRSLRAPGSGMHAFAEPSSKPKHPPTADGVRAAFHDVLRDQGVANEPDGSWVSIADIRDKLSGTRAEQDAALREFEQLPDTNIVPQANQKVLTDRTRAGSVRIGGQDKTHLTVIPPEREPSRPGPGERRGSLAKAGARLAATAPRTDAEVEAPAQLTEAKVLDLLHQLRDRFHAEEGGLGDIVPLDYIRQQLGNVDQDTLNRILRALDRARVITLEPEPNRKALTQSMRDAAVSLGGEDKHYVLFR